MNPCQFTKKMDECKERIDKVRDIITKRREEEEDKQNEAIATRVEHVVKKIEEGLYNRFTRVILEEDEYDEHIKDWLRGLSVEKGLSIDFGVGGKPRVVYAVSLK